MRHRDGDGLELMDKLLTHGYGRGMFGSHASVRLRLPCRRSDPVDRRLID